LQDLLEQKSDEYPFFPVGVGLIEGVIVIGLQFREVNSSFSPRFEKASREEKREPVYYSLEC
jgi:hypothetical protein